MQIHLFLLIRFNSFVFSYYFLAERNFEVLHPLSLINLFPDTTKMDPYKITFESWNKAARLYQEKFMDVDLYNDTYDTFCNLVTQPSANILEIGCGPGNITRYLLSKRSDFNILVTDVAPEMVYLARINNPGVKFKIIDCREIDQLDGKYDGIVCGFTMPYLSKDDCFKLIRDCSSLLNPGGILYMSTMEDDYDKSGFKTGSDGETRVFMYFHQENYITNVLNQHNFEVIEFCRKNCPNADGTYAVDMIFVARKK